LDYALGADPRLASARAELARRERGLQAAGAAGADADAAREAAERYAEALDAYARAGGYERETEAERALAHVGLPEEAWARPFRSLSGGQQTRAALARLLVLRPKALLLDEPTNHLDEETLQWLQRWVRGYAGAVVVVSHDRAFLDAVADRIVELTANGAKSYKGNYAAYVEQKALERKTQAALYRKQELEREAIERSIRMYRDWYAKASRDAARAELGIAKPYYAARANKHTARYHAKEKELERLNRERVEKPRDAETLRVAFRAGTLEAKTLLQAEQVGFRYAGAPRPLFAGGRLDVRRGDKLAIVGPNGAGKTTLLRLLTGELQPTEGVVRRHPELKIGYFSQQVEHLNDEETLLDGLLRVPGMTQSFARTVLGCFLFGGDAAFRRVGELSMGERCRAAFLQLYFGGADLLVLDEPTNYLDIETRERMETALAEFPGAMIVVSHDKYFLRATVNRVLALPGDGAWRVYEEPFAAYETHGAAQPASADARERADALRVAELERAAVLAKPELTDADRSRLEALSRELRELRGGGGAAAVREAPHEPAQPAQLGDQHVVNRGVE
ncbi:ribosomal protection-like ABC-F family protein, partial [Paenibacillus sp.]|uniref:ribosomal protection-like ABC-F family protein n=1 Tax=Paenibacillus sp. TaxID=58172 RepID=UPI002D55554A